MKETGKIFTGASVLQILAGAKTETRRIVDPQPRVRSHSLQPMFGISPPPNPTPHGTPYLWREVGPDYPDGDDDDRRHPDGVPGDRLWVRERYWRDARDPGVVIYDATAEIGKYRAGDRLVRSSYPNSDRTHEYPTREEMNREMSTNRFWKRVSPIFLPRWAARITLEITALRCEQLHDIDCAGAMAEGIPQTAGEAHALGLLDGAPGHEWDNRTSVENYARLWDKLNLRRGFPWRSNPWVWVITFKRVET